MKNLLKKLKALLGIDFYDRQPIYALKFEGNFYKPTPSDDAGHLYGKVVFDGFDIISRVALLPDALGMGDLNTQKFVVHVITPIAATAKGRRTLRKWFIAVGLDRTYIDDKIVQFHTPNKE